MTFIDAIILGIVQGVTEFLPVSSTGHLILIRDVLNVSDSHALAFDAILHLATAAAVLLYFRRDLWRLFQTFLRLLGRLPVDRTDARLIAALIWGTVPAVVLGLLLEDLMESLFRSPLLVAGVLVAGSILFAIAEYKYEEPKRQKKLGATRGFTIGLFQALALIPGMSRSGAAISGGMLLGLSRVEAARFAFLLAVPVMLGAGGKKFFELMAADGGVVWSTVATGAAVSFLVGLAAIHFMLSFVRRHTLWPFIWYRVILAGVVVFAVFFG
jgi:undecaprenyl-diphosphatase